MTQATNLEGLKIHRERSAPARRRRGRWIRRGVAIAVLLVLLFLFRRPLGDLYDRMTLPEVEVALVERSTGAAAAAIRGKAANGYVVAARRAALSSDFAGRIAAMNVREGSPVKEGDVVARLDSTEQAAAAAVAKAELSAANEAAARAEADLHAADVELDRVRREEEAARAAVDAADARVARTAAELARVRTLVTQKVATQSELDDALAGSEVAEADLRAATARLAAAAAAVKSHEARTNVVRVEVRMAEARREAAQAALDGAEAALEKTNIRAPFDGIVVLKDAEVGEVVSPFSQGGSNARGSVVTMVDFASLEVQANVPETTLDAVAIGAPARVFLDAWPDRAYEGRVDRIWPTADREKGTVEVRVVLANPDDRLRPDLGARVVFLPPDADPRAASEGPDRILAPGAAILDADDGSFFVFLVERDRVRRTAVATGETTGGRVEIRSGLAEGDVVVLNPPEGLEDGDRVRVR